MKIINLIFQALISLFLVFIFLYWLLSYDSAFEADKACHSLLSNYQENKEMGCDHDIETHKWILYENQEDGISTKIIKKFRYRFL
tara:strand:- start:2270 stop:2524 length:255 start_codon:yes stop_codon:yes gene_type:complete